MIIVAATGNQHKIQEISAILAPFKMQVISRAEAGVPDIEIEEDGLTFEENSRKKAVEIMKLSGKIAIADDSGLEVEVLNGEPGVYSARYAGEGATDQRNNEKLLNLLKDVPDEKRAASFVSVVTMVFPDGKVLVARGECRGHILRAPRGSNGFGYDPLFVPNGHDKTFAELSSVEKNKISHRANALLMLRTLLEAEES